MEKKQQKKEHKGKKFLWGKGCSTKEDTRLGVYLDDDNAILPNLYLASLAHLLDKTPKQLLAMEISMPWGRVHDYITFQQNHDKGRGNSEECHQTINNHITHEVFSHPENIIIALAKIQEEQLDTMHFPTIHKNIKEILQQKIKDTQVNLNNESWTLARSFLFGFNCSLVMYGGLRLWSTQDDTVCGSALTGVGTIGLCALLPMLYKHYASIKDSLITLYTYQKIRSQEHNENFVVYHITNEQ